MFNLFSKKPTPFENKVGEKSIVKESFVKMNKSTNELVQEIHTTFDTEVERLLAQAMQGNSLETDHQELIDKRNRLVSLGFSSTKECQEAVKEIDRLNKLKSENLQKESLIKAISYFSQKYPQYKFITEESVIAICEKYNLIYGEVKRYIGTVPDESLRQMENFKISEDDTAYVEELQSGFGSIRTKIISKPTKEENQFYQIRSSHYRYNVKKASLEIAAPLKDFNTQGMEIKNSKLSKIEIPDPIVLQPVMYNKEKYYLIVAKWGLEASDPLVVNEKMN